MSDSNKHRTGNLLLTFFMAGTITSTLGTGLRTVARPELKESFENATAMVLLFTFWCAIAALTQFMRESK